MSLEIVAKGTGKIVRKNQTICGIAKTKYRGQLQCKTQYFVVKEN